MDNMKFFDNIKTLAPHLSGIPTPTIEIIIRDVAIDICNRTLFWKSQVTPIELVAGQHEYKFVGPEGTEVQSIKHFNLKDYRIYTATLDTIKYEFPDWPSDEESYWTTPRYISEIGLGSFVVAPTPDKAYTLNMVASLRPSNSSDGMDRNTLEAMSNAMFHGVLQRAMLMPGKGWSHSRTATYHGKQYSFHLSLLRVRTNVGQFGSSVRAKHQRFV